MPGTDKQESEILNDFSFFGVHYAIYIHRVLNKRFAYVASWGLYVHSVGIFSTMSELNAPPRVIKSEIVLYISGFNAKHTGIPDILLIFRRNTHFKLPCYL